MIYIKPNFRLTNRYKKTKRIVEESKQIKNASLHYKTKTDILSISEEAYSLFNDKKKS